MKGPSMDDYAYLKGKSEEDIIANRALDLTPLLQIIDDCHAVAVDTGRRDKLLIPAQHHLKMAEFINLLVHNQWRRDQLDNPWKIDDNCYTHLIDEATQMHLELHPADPWTRGLPAPANTKAAHARYMQSECLPADRVDWNMTENGICPDLSHVHLQAIWQYTGNRISVMLYKPVEGKKRKSCIEIPLRGDRVEQSKIRYEAAEENEILLPDLIDDEHSSEDPARDADGHNRPEEEEQKNKVRQRKENPFA